ncbi:hypothetical protein AXG93_3309s1310 [Marchantia polymorpha subsp. ruderalis]|uniref:Uncharacterized protein n=1 Tax=Marchantia polymorpha subsp. ruderalis TaxID=1480154 RepID=A0A176W4H8_MARPO|nr:hypothetical protein AXG93_3309s1310 [Marchantia polymorpha subsp. ruderalis]
MKTERMELRGRIGARSEVHNRKLQRANELMASLAEPMKKHKVELADWAKKLTDCELAKFLEICHVGNANVEVAEIGFAGTAVDEHEDQQNRRAQAVG